MKNRLTPERLGDLAEGRSTHEHMTPGKLAELAQRRGVAFAQLRSGELEGMARRRATLPSDDTRPRG